MAAELDELDESGEQDERDEDEAPAQTAQPKRDAKGHFIRVKPAGESTPRPRGRPRGSRTRKPKADMLEGEPGTAPRPKAAPKPKAPHDPLRSVWESGGQVVAGGLQMLSLATLGPRNAMTKDEAANIVTPAGRILGRRLPTVKIASNLAGPDRQDAELILSTTIEYVLRLTAQWVALVVLKWQAAARAQAQAAAQSAPGPMVFEAGPAAPQGAEVVDESATGEPVGRSEQQPSMEKWATVFPGDYGATDGA